MASEMPDVIWHQCQSQLRSELPEQQYNTWIRPLTIGQSHVTTEGELCLLAPNRFIQDWVKNKFTQRIEELCSQFGGRSV
jgi:chromosomal replication initiator protein